jgi:hypothetical protein
VPTTSYSNSSVATLASSSTTSKPDYPTCCYIWGQGVAFETVWTGSVDVTVSTVITQIIKYNNTQITTTTKVPNTSINVTELYQYYPQNFVSGIVTVSDLDNLDNNFEPYSGISLGPGTVYSTGSASM